jgi:hypothetical protein
MVWYQSPDIHLSPCAASNGLTTLQGLALPSLTLLPHPLSERVEAARLHVLRDLAVSGVGSVLLDSLQKVCQIARRQFDDGGLVFVMLMSRLHPLEG